MDVEKNSVVLLTDRQRKIVGAAAVCAALAALAAFGCGVLWALGKFLTAFSSVLWPLVIAALLSFLLQPVCAWLERKARLPRPAAVGALYAAVLVVCGVLAIIVLPPVIAQLSAFVRTVPVLWADVAAFVKEQTGGDVRAWLAQSGVLASDAPQALAKAALPTLATAGGSALSFFGTVAGAATVPVYLYYMLNSRRDALRDLREECVFVPARWRDDFDFLARQFIGILTSYFRGQLLVGVILGAVLAGGFTIAGLRFGLLIGLCAGLLNVVPYMGTVIGLGVALPLAYFQPAGGGGLLAAVLGVFVAAQLFESYYLSPRIVGKTTGLHPFAIIVSVFFWGIALDGLLGAVLAVPLTAFLVVFWRLAKAKYLPAAISGSVR